MGTLPRVIVTGASGFLGRRILEVIARDHEVFAIDRRSQRESNAPAHPNIHWFQMDLGETERLEELFLEIGDTGGADTLIHLAAHYDFTGEDHPEYQRTNLEATRMLLDLCRGIRLGRFVFASSVAACKFPLRGEALDEDSPADGGHIYAETKRLGEEMLKEYADDFPSCIVRLAALYSDWCHYLPFYLFVETWLSDRWNSKILGGRGLSAVPYLHVRDAALFFRRVIERQEDLDPCEVLIASPDGSTSHCELFEAATAYYFGAARIPRLMPKPLATIGIWARDLLGRLLGQRPFERTWMADYIDLKLAVDSSRTRGRLDWAPHPRLGVIRRLPFLIENRRSDPLEWMGRNLEAMEAHQLRPNLRIYQLLESHQSEIVARYADLIMNPEGDQNLSKYQKLSRSELAWSHQVFLRNLMNSVRSREKGIFMAYCRDLAEHRYRQGFSLDELSEALRSLDKVSIDVLKDSADAVGLERDLRDSISMTIEFGIDQVQETYEYLEAGGGGAPLSHVQAHFWNRADRGSGFEDRDKTETR